MNSVRKMISQLRPWRRYGTSRSTGEIVLRRNGDFVDLWLRVQGRPYWVGIPAAPLAEFIASTTEWWRAGLDKNLVLKVESSLPPDDEAES